MAKNIIYLRVSKEDEEKQDPEQQLNAILEKYDLKDYELFQERGSAYDLERIHKRKEFLKILDLCFDSNSFTIKDLYLQKASNKQINLYVWDYSRIIRNIELNVIFSLLANNFNVKIHSYKDKSILQESKKETPTAKLTRIMMNTISAYSAEEYSYTISENTKKAYAGNGFSTKGRQWGKGFTATDDNPNRSETGRVSLSEEELTDLHRYIKRLIANNLTRNQIIKRVEKKRKIKLNPSYLSRHF